jgi:hypothetical protein
MSAGKVVLGVVGGFLAVVGLAVLVGGAGLLWVFSTQRNADGFFESPVAEMSTEGYAITSTEMDMGALPTASFGSGWLANVQVTATSRADRPVFIGIGPSGEVDDYLAGVARSEVIDIDSRTGITYLTKDGDSPESVPSGQGFWVLSAEGPGSQSFDWDIERGDWTIVIMNADATLGVDLDVAAGVHSNWIPVTLVLLLLFGAFCVGAASVMSYFAYRRTMPAVPDVRTPQVTDHVLSGSESDTSG